MVFKWACPPRRPSWPRWSPLPTLIRFPLYFQIRGRKFRVSPGVGAAAARRTATRTFLSGYCQRPRKGLRYSFIYGTRRSISECIRASFVCSLWVFLAGRGLPPSFCFGFIFLFIFRLGILGVTTLVRTDPSLYFHRQNTIFLLFDLFFF